MPADPDEYNVAEAVAGCESSLIAEHSSGSARKTYARWLYAVTAGAMMAGFSTSSDHCRKLVGVEFCGVR